MPKLEQRPATPLLTKAQVAEILGKDVSTINRWVRSGRLPIAQQLPGKTGAYLFDAEAVRELAQEAS